MTSFFLRLLLAAAAPFVPLPVRIRAQANADGPHWAVADDRQAARHKLCLWRTWCPVACRAHAHRSFFLPSPYPTAQRR